MKLCKIENVTKAWAPWTRFLFLLLMDLGEYMLRVKNKTGNCKIIYN